MGLGHPFRPTEENPVDISTASPVEIDTELARLYGEIALRNTASNRLLDRHRRITGQDEIYDYQLDTLSDLRRDITALERQIAQLSLQAAPLEAYYRDSGGWTRYYLVDAHNGHVHHDVSNRRCSRTPTTTHLWLTTESGRPRADVIADAGERCCTMCFPEAPVDVLSRPSKYHTPTEIEKQARQVEREFKAVQRAAKAITNPDGTPLRINLGGYWETIGTVISAQRKLVDIAFDAKYQGRSTNEREVSACQVILAALAAKTGTDAETLKNEATARLIKKCKREGITY